MADYVFYPVTGDGLTKPTAYTWNVGTIAYTNGADWTLVQSFETLTLGGTVDSGTVPGAGDNAGVVAGAISPAAFALYTPNPSLGDPYIAGSIFPVDILLNSGAVVLNNFLLSGFNQYASVPIFGGTTPRFPTFDVEGASFTVTGNILDTATVTFPPISIPFLGTISSSTATGGGTIEIGQGGTVSIGGAVPSDITFHFNDGANNVLSIGGDSKGTPTAFNGLITGYQPGDTILLPAVPFVAGGITTTGSYDVATGILTFTVGDPVFIDLRIPGFTNTSGPVTVLAAGTGIEVVPCFLKGTQILGPAGEVAVEDLSVGDLVRTATGALKPVVWIGSGQALATRGRRDAATPVIVRKGAIAENVPRRNLRVTKGHSLFVDGVLIPAEFLVNHRTILWDDHAQEVTVYHVELSDHDVIVADGAPAETYRDDGNRWLFHNANPGWDMPPKPACAPVLTGGPKVDAIWRRLLDRAGPRRGLPLTDDPDLHLLVNDRRIDPARRFGETRVFLLDDAPDSVRIVSRCASPQELGLARDPRILGVGIRRVMVRQGPVERVVDAADSVLVDGCHAYEAEPGLCWTSGDAGLAPALWAGLTGGLEIVLTLAGSMRYLDEGVRRRVA